MAIQFWQNRGAVKKTRFLALEKAYHGDTTGAMSVCDPVEGMHALFAPLLPKHLFLLPPRGGFDATPEEVAADIAKLEQTLAEHHRELAAMILEPIVQAAGGFNIYSPDYLRQVRRLCEQYEVLLICDEVATGFGRTGRLFACEHAGVCPDILVLGKGLTAGYLGHSATLATDRVYGAFLGQDAGRCFMHGPTFMGNPTACAVALKSIELIENGGVLERIARIETVLREELLPLRSERIADTRVLGAIGVVEAVDGGELAGLQAFAADRGVWLRPFGRWAYTMPPYVITDDELRQVCAVLRDWFTRG